MKEGKQLRIVYCRWLPARVHMAVTIMRWLIVRKKMANKLSPVVLNRHHILYAQERELWYVGYAMLYAAMFLMNLLVMWDVNRAHKNVPFIAEAYTNERKLDYLSSRKRFAWRNGQYLTSSGNEQDSPDSRRAVA